MICKVISLLAIIALAQAKSTGKFASFGSPPKNDIRDDDSESRPTTRFARFYPPAANYQVQEVDSNEPKSNNNYASLRSNVEDYNGHEDEYYNGHPKYKYTYSVNDENTGDYKSHFEERDGDTVRGEYVVADPDGSIRRVTYTADSKNGFQALVKTTKKDSPHYENESLQTQNENNYKPHIHPAIPTEPSYTESDYNKYYQQKPKIPHKPSYTESNYNKYYQQNPEIPQKPSYTETKYYQQKPEIPQKPSYIESNYNKYYQQKPAPRQKPSYTESDYDDKYFQQIPAENTRPLEETNQNYYKSYARPTIPTETNFKPYIEPIQTSYKQYLKPTTPPRHHNLVSELKYQDRLNNHRLTGPGFDSEEDLKEVPETFNLSSYKFGKGQETGSGERYNSGYSFRPKSQKDQDGLGSDVFTSYASPEFEDVEYSPIRFFDQ